MGESYWFTYWLNMTMTMTNLVIGVWLVGIIAFFPINRKLHSVFKNHTFLGFKSLFRKDVYGSCHFCAPERMWIAFIWPIVLVLLLIKGLLSLVRYPLSIFESFVWVLEGCYEVRPEEDEEEKEEE